jgi:hypothetical protein
MKKLLMAALSALLAASLCAPSFAQPGPTHNPGGVPAYDTPTDTNRITCISGCASAIAFTPTGGTTKVTAGSGASASGALSATGPNLIINNVGANGVWLTLGVGSATAAVGSTYYIPSSQALGMASGANTFVAVYGVGGVSDVYFTPGSGSPAGWGGGGGGVNGFVGQGSTTSGQTGPLVQCASLSTIPTYTTGTTNPVRCDSATGDIYIINIDPTTHLPINPQSPINAGPNTTFVQAATHNDVISVEPRQLVSVTTGGATPYHLVTAATTNSTLISAGAHTLYTLQVTGLNTTVGYLKIIDSATAPASCGTTTAPVHNFPMIGSATVLGGFNYTIPPQGEAYALGLTFCWVGGVADNDNTAGPANVLINATYK